MKTETQQPTVDNDFDEVPFEHSVELEEDFGSKRGIELDEDDPHDNFDWLTDKRPATWLTDVGSIEDYARQTPVDWIHRGILMEGMSTIFVAREGVGKSLFAVNLANAVANGLSFLGQTHKPRPVLYLDRENPLAVVEKRAKEFKIRSGGNLTYVGLYAHNGEVPNPGTKVGGVDQVLNYVNRQWIPPLIVLDSLVRFMPGNENATEAPKAFWERIKPLTGRGCSFLILHHAGKGETTQQGRGSTDIVAGCDILYMFNKAKDGEDEHKNLRKMKMQLWRTRYPEDAISTKSTVNISAGGVWSLGPSEVKEAVQSQHTVMRDLLKANPGCTGRKLEDLADSKKIGQSFFRKWKKEMVESGNVIVKNGDKRAELLTWNGDHPDSPSKGLLPVISISDVPAAKRTSEN
jgi:hypothetical protein